MEDLALSIRQNESQLQMVKDALISTVNPQERESLSALQSELEELIKLTKESLDAQQSNENKSQLSTVPIEDDSSNELDQEYALFMKEMSASGAYEKKINDLEDSKNNSKNSDSSDIEDELESLLGMKCAVYHTHSWGGQPTLHNAMVSSVVPRKDDDQFNDLQVRVLYTHPTHTEMLPCPFYLSGECKFSDEQCRYSHGAIVNLSYLKEAIEPDYECIKVGSSILLKLKPPDDEDMSIAKKSTEKYHLWHRALVTGVDQEQRMCVAKLEQGAKVGEKRKSVSEDYHVQFEEIFPLHGGDIDSSSDDSLSDTEYPEVKTASLETEDKALLIEKSLQNNAPAMGEWERHTRGMGSKLMLAMGYVPGTGLGAAADGRLRPVEARVMPKGASLDRALQIAERHAAKDPLEVEKKLRRLQKKEEERNKRAYEREKERERRNVFNFINKTLGNKGDSPEPSASDQKVDIKQSTSKDLNIEQFKVAEECRKLEAEILRLNNCLIKYPSGTNGHRSINGQISEKNKELSILKDKERQISNEQKHRKDKQKLTIF